MLDRALTSHLLRDALATIPRTALSVVALAALLVTVARLNYDNSAALSVAYAAGSTVAGLGLADLTISFAIARAWRRIAAKQARHAVTLAGGPQ